MCLICYLWCLYSLWSRSEKPQKWPHHAALNSQLKGKAPLFHRSPVSPQILSEFWPPRPEPIQTLRALWPQARKCKSTQLNYTEGKRRASYPTNREKGPLNWLNYNRMYSSQLFFILYQRSPPSLLRHAVTAGEDHIQSRTDGEPAVGALRQQSPHLPEPEPWPGCTGNAQTRMTG